MRPDAGTAFAATYRVGNGIAGNVGADSIAHAVTTEGRIAAVANPLPATGGRAPETAAEVRRRAPQAFRTQERAVTPADYAEVTQRLPDVQRAAAGLRWTGSWHTVFVTVDREGGAEVDDAYATTVVDHLERYRMAGHDVRVREPVHVSLEIDLLVCVNRRHFAADVRAGLVEVLGSGLRRDGRRGLFHPDNFSFGQTVYLSPLYAAAREVPGVDSVQVTRFHRQGQEDPEPLADGYMRARRARDRAARERPELPRARRPPARPRGRQVMACGPGCDCDCCAGIDARTPGAARQPAGAAADRLPRRAPRHASWSRCRRACRAPTSRRSPA